MRPVRDAAVSLGRTRRLVGWCRAAAALVLLPCALSSHAGGLRYCDDPVELSAAQKDRLLRVAAVVRATLESSDARIVLVSRSGLDLERYGVRYSHAGLSVRDGLDTPWAVRQLYYACDEKRPRVYDQGLAAFVLGMNDPARGQVSAVLLPEPDAAALAPALVDRRMALQLLGTTYSANAYPYSLRYQNCNQWVAEVLAMGWGRLVPEPGGGSARGQAQQWLRSQGYRPTVFEVAFPPLRWLGAIVPWLHHDDHPPADVDAQRLQVSMPAALEAFVRERVPQARRIEFCHAGARVVVRRGWEPIDADCRPGPGDEVVTLD
jgi:hypothetical protein